MDHTCHILKSESGWCIASGVTLLITDPGFIQVLHEAILMGTINSETKHISQTIRYSRNRNSWQIAVSLGISWKEQKKKEKSKQKYSGVLWMISLDWDYLRMASETFCFHGLSLRMPIPNPERKNSSPVVTRSHFCEASNSNTAESHINAWSLLWEEKIVVKIWQVLHFCNLNFCIFTIYNTIQRFFLNNFERSL